MKIVKIVKIVKIMKIMKIMKIVKIVKIHVIKIQGWSDEGWPPLCTLEVTRACRLGSGDRNEPIQVIEEAPQRSTSTRFAPV